MSIHCIGGSSYFITIKSSHLEGLTTLQIVGNEFLILKGVSILLTKML